MLGDRIAELRCANNMTQEALAQKMHISVSTVRNWERNDNAPTGSIIKHLCRALNVDPNKLFEYDDGEVIRVDHLTKDQIQALIILIQSMQNSNMEIERLQSKTK